MSRRTVRVEGTGRGEVRRWIAVPLVVFLLSASGAGALAGAVEWHISLYFTQPTYVPGQPLALTGSLSPGQQATIVLTVILPDGSTNIFYVDTDPAGDFNFTHLWGGLGYYGAFGTVLYPKTEANVTTDMAHCIVIYRSPDTTTTTSVPTSTTTISTTNTTTSTTSSTTTTGEGTQTKPSAGGSLPPEIYLPVAIVAAAAFSLLAVTLVRRFRRPP